MHPVLKRILIHGGLTAGVLALMGLLFAELASLFAAGNTGKPTSADLNPQLPDSLRYRVPITLALAGFLFVAAGEYITLRFRKNKPQADAKTAQAHQDDAEKLLNELLAQAEAKMALEAESQKAENREQKPEDREQTAENGGQKTEEKPNAPPV